MARSLARATGPVQLPMTPATAGKRPWRALGMVRSLEFDTPGYRFVSAPFVGNEPVLEGRIREIQLQPGLWMHCAEVVDLHSMVSRVNFSAGLRIVIVLAGEVDVRIGGQPLHLRAGDHAHHASAAIVSMPQDAMFERLWERGKWERKLSLHLTPEWLESQGWLRDSCELTALSRRHETGAPEPLALKFPDELCITPWHPSPHALALAEQLICQSDQSAPGLVRIRLASRAMELLYEALASQRKETAPNAAPTGAMRPRDQDRMLRLRNFLDAEVQQPLIPPLKIDELGRRFGLSASALQRQFRNAFGSSVNEYRRLMRLHQARTDLEHGSSIAEASYRAGYTSAANFATAFRRQFGMSPKSLRSHV
ncbi:helix-turn-helix domain-containing protein [Parapusillimonas sp. JC17]|uniref:helix-turn-helix transcriptional regulator n=1 Tax=Parapusillimonas sp. JC17 TaxID=3445768 RepID=UPI003FA14703